MAKTSVTRRKAKPTRTAKRKARPADPVATPAERMQIILRLYQEHAWTLPQNALLSHKTPLADLFDCAQQVADAPVVEMRS